MSPERAWQSVDFNELPSVECSCGLARRAFEDRTQLPATIHRTEITSDAQLHYHLRQTETYYILECEPGAQLQLDNEFLPVCPGVCVTIPPGVRHRGVGRMTILNIVIPKHDPLDEHYD